MNDLEKQNQTLPSTPEELSAYYASMAEDYAQTERRAGSSISIRNGVLSVGDQSIPGNQFAAIILDAARINTFYATAFNPQSIEPPKCYAIGRNDTEMAPHPSMSKDLSYFQPQAERCGACPHNEFGTSRTGVGKACSNRRRLLLLLAGTYAQSPQGWVLQPILDLDHYATSALLTLSVAPTSIGGWGEFVRKAASDYHQPPFGVIARVHLYVHPKHGKEALGFETLAPIPDAWRGVILKRHMEAEVDIMEGYEPPQQIGNQRGGGFYQIQNQQVR